MLIKRSALKQIALFFLMTTFAFLMDKQYKKELIFQLFFMAEVLGFEPKMTESEARNLFSKLPI